MLKILENIVKCRCVGQKIVLYNSYLLLLLITNASHYWEHFFFKEAVCLWMK